MKNIFKFMIFFVLTTLIWSCDKDEKKNYLEGGTAPVLSANKTVINLSYATAADEAVTFSWTNPNYMFTTGVSSQNVNYVMEIDTTGANFTNPNKKELAISMELVLTLTQASLNDYLLNQLVLKPGMNHNLDIRVKSTMANNSAPLYSNVMKYTVKPYAIPPKVTPPASGNLWIIGSAVASAWTNPLPSPYDVTQKFTRKSETLYELTIDLIGGANGYKLIQINGDWEQQYHAIDGKVVTGGDFKKENSDPQFPSPAASGKYKITVDFQRGKYFVEPA